MHVHLIAPSNEDSTNIKPLWAATLAAHTPGDVELTFRDDGITPIDLDKENDAPDLVGINVNTKNAWKAYRMADEYRRRGSQVVLGGIHVTACPDEAAEHADSVVVGEAEGLWHTCVNDARKRKMQKFYQHSDWPALENLPTPDRSIFPKSFSYVPFDVVQTTRGCPFPCEFCSVSTYNGPTFRFRPVKEVITELEGIGNKILFGDDNVMIHTKYSHDLFEAMVPLKKHWVAQASLAALHKIENIEVMARAGCKALFIGFESVDDATVRGNGKRQNKPHKYAEIVKQLADHGIAVWGAFVFGFDEDKGDSFLRTVDFCIESKMTFAQFAMLTPYPGTRLYKRLKSEGRLTDDQWWMGEYDDSKQPFYKPAQMTGAQLKEGWIKAWKAMYSYKSIRERYQFNLDHSWIQNIAYWPMNIMMHELAEKKIGNQDRHWRRHRAVHVPFGL